MSPHSPHAKAAPAALTARRPVLHARRRALCPARRRRQLQGVRRTSRHRAAHAVWPLILRLLGGSSSSSIRGGAGMRLGRHARLAEAARAVRARDGQEREALACVARAVRADFHGAACLCARQLRTTASDGREEGREEVEEAEKACQLRAARDLLMARGLRGRLGTRARACPARRAARPPPRCLASPHFPSLRPDAEPCVGCRCHGQGSLYSRMQLWHTEQSGRVACVS